MKTKNNFIEKNATDITIRILRIICEKGNYSILRCLPEREYFIRTNSNFNSIDARLSKLIQLDIVERYNKDKYKLTYFGKNIMKKIDSMKPQMINNMKKRLS